MTHVHEPGIDMLRGGKVRLIRRRLPDSVICTLLPDLPDGILRIIIDPTKPDALAHVLLVLRDYCEEPVTRPRRPAVVARRRRLVDRGTTDYLAQLQRPDQ